MGIEIVRFPQLNTHLLNVTHLSAGNEHALALTKTGELFTWGSAALTGHDNDQNKHQPAPLFQFSGNSSVVQARCGGLHTCIVTRSGEVYCWGSNEGGQLGLVGELAIKECIRTPQLVTALAEHNVTDVACGETHTVVLTRERRVFGWGMSMYG